MNQYPRRRPRYLHRVATHGIAVQADRVIVAADSAARVSPRYRLFPPDEDVGGRGRKLEVA